MFGFFSGKQKYIFYLSNSKSDDPHRRIQSKYHNSCWRKTVLFRFSGKNAADKKSYNFLLYFNCLIKMAYYGGEYSTYGNGMYGGNMMMNHSLMNGVMNGTFFFNGEATLLETRIHDIPEQKINEVKQAQLMISGNLVKQYNTFCVICTIIWGSIFIFPLCFLCCDWWKKIAYPIYDVNYQAYGSLDRLLRCPNLQHLRLQVTDNLFNDSKAQALYDSISRSSLRSFHFVNMAMDYDVQADQYSRFKQRMSPFKKLNIVSQIRWQWDVVLS